MSWERQQRRCVGHAILQSDKSLWSASSAQLHGMHASTAALQSDAVAGSTPAHSAIKQEAVEAAVLQRTPSCHPERRDGLKQDSAAAAVIDISAGTDSEDELPLSSLASSTPPRW